MKLHFKKIIAREFLIFTVVLLSGILCFLCVYPYNYYRDHQISEKNKKISEKTKISDSLSHTYAQKTENKNWLFNHLLRKFYDNSDSMEVVWNKLDNWSKKDSIRFRWENKWNKTTITIIKEIGFQTPEELTSFFEINRMQQIDLQNFNAEIELNKEVNKLEEEKNGIGKKKFSFVEQYNFGLTPVILFSILFFGFRYLLYSLRWSMRILQQKNE